VNSASGLKTAATIVDDFLYGGGRGRGNLLALW